jgi:hypothetical protein
MATGPASSQPANAGAAEAVYTATTPSVMPTAAKASATATNASGGRVTASGAAVCPAEAPKGLSAVCSGSDGSAANGSKPPAVL